MSGPLRPSCRPDAHVRNDYARLPRGHVCIDIQPNTPTLVPDPSDTLNIGGFSDGVLNPVAVFKPLAVFNTMAVFNPVAVFNTMAVLNPVAVLLTDDTGRFGAEVKVVEL